MIVKSLPFNKTIGGHAIAAIMGYKKNTTAIDIWEQLKGEKSPSFEDNLEADIGRALEPVIINNWRKMNNLTESEIDYGVNVIDDEYDFLTGHIDAVQYKLAYAHDESFGVPHIERIPYRIIEAKTAHHKKILEYGEVGTNQVPPEHLVQSMWYAMLYKVSDAVIPAYFNGAINEYIIEGDKEFHAAIREIGIRFWKENVLKDIPPLPQNEKEVNQYYRRSNGRAVEATSEQLQLAAMLKKLKIEKKENEEQQSDIGTKLKITMQENEAITFNDKVICTWKSNETPRFDSKALQEKYPEVYEQFRVIDIKRPLLIK